MLTVCGNNFFAKLETLGFLKVNLRVTLWPVENCKAPSAMYSQGKSKLHIFSEIFLAVKMLLQQALPH
jgi:hypothetical protein